MKGLSLLYIKKRNNRKEKKIHNKNLMTEIKKKKEKKHVILTFINKIKNSETSLKIR